MFKNIKIGTRLSLSFGALLILMSIVGGYGLLCVESLDGEIDLIANDRMVKVRQANDIMHNVNIIARGLRNIVIDEDKGRQATELQRIADSRKKAGELFETLNNTIKSEKGKTLIKQGIDARMAYVRSTEAYMDLVKNGQIDQAKTKLLTEVREVQGAYLKALGELIDFQLKFLT